MKAAEDVSHPFTFISDTPTTVAGKLIPKIYGTIDEGMENLLL